MDLVEPTPELPVQLAISVIGTVPRSAPSHVRTAASAESAQRMALIVHLPTGNVKQIALVVRVVHISDNGVA